MFDRVSGLELGDEVTNLLTESFIKVIKAGRNIVFIPAANPFNKLIMMFSGKMVSKTWLGRASFSEWESDT